MEDYVLRVIRSPPVAATVLSDLHDTQGVSDDPQRDPRARPRARLGQ